MAYEVLNPNDVESEQANGDLSATQYLALKFTGSKVTTCTVAGEPSIGVLQNLPKASGRAAAIARSGISKLAYGGTIAMDDPLTVNSSGKYVKGFGADRMAARARIAGSNGDVGCGVVYGGSPSFCQHPQIVRSYTYDLASIATGSVLVTLSLADFIGGGRISRISAIVMLAASTGGKAATLTPQITGVNLTGGVLALTTANMTPIGTEVAGTTISALNTFAATDTFSLVASAVTTFIEGQVEIQVVFA